MADQSPSTHPVAGNGAPDSAAALQDFDGISYAKGGAVVRQLAAYVGDEVFLGGLRSYFERYRFGNATFADLIRSWTEAGATDLDRWAAAWLQTTGMDTIDVSGRPPQIAIEVTPAHPDQPARRHAIAVGAVSRDGRVLATVPVEATTRPTALEVPAGTILVVPDARDETWAKIRFGSDGWRAVAEALPGITDESVLVTVYNAIRDAVRDATLDPALALELICDSVADTASDVIYAGLTAFAHDQLAVTFSPVEDRARRRDRVHQVARRSLSRLDTGPDRRLTAFRLAIRSASDPELLRRWWAGDDLPVGLALDPELRWAMVVRLAALTGDETLIESTLLADSSASATVHAARARAALPSVEAKAAAWELLMRPSAASAYEVYATGDGFFDPDQSALTAPFVPAYFDQIAQTASFRSGWVLGETAARAFPRTAVHRDTVRWADQLLETDLAAPVRRSVVDAADRLRRALASLDRFTRSAA